MLSTETGERYRSRTKEWTAGDGEAAPARETERVVLGLHAVGDIEFIEVSRECPASRPAAGSTLKHQMNNENELTAARREVRKALAAPTAFLCALATLLVVLAMPGSASAATAAAEGTEQAKAVYGWTCKTASGEVVREGMHSVPFNVGQVVVSTVEPHGKGTGIKDAGVCSQIRFDLDDGRKAMCEPTGIPVAHAFIGGWKYAPIDKSKCKA